MKFNLNIKHNNKIFLAMLAFLVIAFIGAARSENNVPAQDADGYYLIGTKAELEWFRDQVNAAPYSMKYNAKLVNDIDLKGSETDQWVPIGEEKGNKSYKGIFDGQGYMIKGLYINNTSDYQGLFGVIENDSSVVKNVRIYGSVTANNYVAGICGLDVGGMIMHCGNNITVHGKSYVGGICGYMRSQGHIWDSYNTGAISQLDGGLKNTLGGICGYVSYGNISNCINSRSYWKSGIPETSLCGTAKTEGAITIDCCTNDMSFSNTCTGAICDCAIAENGHTVTISDSWCNYGHICNTAENSGNGFWIAKCNYYLGVGVVDPVPIVNRTGDITLNIVDHNETPVYPKTIIAAIFSKEAVGTTKFLLADVYGNAKVYSVVSSNPDVSTSSAHTEAKKIGETTFNISTNVHDFKFLVKVVENIHLENTEMYLGGKHTFTVPEAINFVKWKSSNEEVATVDEDGTVTALSEGNTTIYAEAEDGSGASDHCTVSVVVPASKIITLKDEKLYIGEQKTIDIASKIANPVGWSSNAPTVATVDENGLVTALSEGIAVISVKAFDGSGNSAKCTINVKKQINLSLNKTEAILRIGTPEKLIVTNTASADEQQVEWVTDNVNVAVVDQNGNVTPVTKGTARITVKSVVDSTKTAYCDVVVREPMEAEMNKPIATMSNGELQLAVKISACDEDDSKEFIWTSSNEAVATVDQNGKVISHSQGSTVITATLKEDANIVVTSTITVKEDATVPEKDASGYYLIGNKPQLVWFRDQVNNGTTNINAKMIRDIDLDCTEDFQWTPIGIDAKPYSGVFDGQGYTVKGLCINNSTSYQAQGLFGTTSGTIQNLTISGSVKALSAGGLCGVLKAEGKIIGCINKAAIQGSGAGASVVCQCEDNAEVRNCVNHSNVSGYSFAGGIVASGKGSESIKNCVNYGRVTSTCFYVRIGGIIGYCHGSIDSCNNSGDVIGDAYPSGSSGIESSCGGVVGELYSAKVSNCLNSGAVKGYQNTGGICGLGNYDDVIDNCVNKGAVSGVDKIGGILGKLNGGTITNCVNSGTVKGDNYVGGLCAYSDWGRDSSGNVIRDSSGSAKYNFDKLIGLNTGKVTNNLSKQDQTGAIIGHANVTPWWNCVKVGYIEGTSSRALGSSDSLQEDYLVSCGSIAVYTAQNLPTAAALILPNNIEQTKTVTAVTLYPENACNKESIGIVLSSSNSSVASVSENNITGNDVGSADITANITGLLGISDALSLLKEIKVTDYHSSASFNPTVSKSTEIAGKNIMAAIKTIFEDLRDTFINAIDVVVEYATDVFDFVSAQKSTLSGALEPVQETGKVTFKLRNTSGVYISEGISYTFGDIVLKIKEGSNVGDTGDIVVTNATYILADNTEHNALCTQTGITVAQPVTSITVTSSTGETTMLVTDSLQLNVEVLPTDAQTKDITWSSSDDTVATVDANGLVTAKEISGKSATVTITATALDGSGVTGNIQLTVTRPDLTGMTFAKKAYRVLAGNSQDLYAELNVAPAMALKPQATAITWTSDNPKITVDTNGRVTMANDAENVTGTITAQCQNEKGQTVSCTATVTTEKVSVNLNLSTKLEGRQNGGGTGTNVEQIEVWLYDSTNHPLWNGTGTTDANGNVSFEIEADALEEGKTVKLWIKGERYLAKLLTQTVTLSGSDWNVTMPEKLKGADAETENSYNSVELRDFLVLRKSFAKDKGETGYDRRADFDNNDAVELADFLILRRNFTVEGDAKPQAPLTMFMTAAARRGSLNTAMSMMNTETAQVAEETLRNSMATDEEQQEEEILYAVQNATGAELKAEKPSAATAESTSSNESSNGSSGSSGGCNAGFGVLALMFAIPLIFKKRK